MTDQEINNLSPEAINEAVAKKLGYKPHPEGLWGSEDNGMYHYPIWLSPKGHVADIKGEQGIDFCHSIEAAWEIVEKIHIEHLFALCWHDGFWHAEIDCVDGERPIDEEGQTAPMAICLAFLKLDVALKEK